MKGIEDLLAGAGAFEGLSRPHLELVAGCGKNVTFDEGAYLMREGDAADTFYVIRRGRVALETFVPQRGGLTVETIDPGQPLGWSWLVPPFRVHLDARALTEIHALAFDAACLRGKCEADPALGYELMKAFVPVIVKRLQGTRFRLLDVYGGDGTR